jgi:hypothetical protein
MIKRLVAGVAITISFAGRAVAREAVHQHHRHHIRPVPSPVQPRSSLSAPDIYWPPEGGNPIHYGQTTGFYGGRCYKRSCQLDSLRGAFDAGRSD